MPKQVVTTYSCDAVEVWLSDCQEEVQVLCLNNNTSTYYRFCTKHAMQYVTERLGADEKITVSVTNSRQVEFEATPHQAVNGDRNECPECVAKGIRRQYKNLGAHRRKYHKVFARPHKEEEKQIEGQEEIFDPTA